MIAKTYSASLHGVEGMVVEIEAAKSDTLPKIQITGLPGDIVKEGRERVRMCLVNLGFDVPTKGILVHLSPASSKKQGSQFDLSIAMSILTAEGILSRSEISRVGFLGEVALDGRVQRVSRAIPLIEALERSEEIEVILLSKENEWEAGLIRSKKVRLVKCLTQAIEFVQGKTVLSSPVPSIHRNFHGQTTSLPTLDCVLGQVLPKRAVQIALAGRHHLLFQGPPGVGKSLIAQCAVSLLPALSVQELIEVAKNYGHLPASEIPCTRPFRSPHHSISAPAFLGGGTGTVIPGEVTLAHSGVLFLDEFPEFRRDVIEGLREPLQNGVIHLHRTGTALNLSARFTLIAAMNPCPCGHWTDSFRRCTCSRDKVNSYRKKISGAIIDRMDLTVTVQNEGDKITATTPTHGDVKKSIERVIEIQSRRYGNSGIQNGDVTVTANVEAFRLTGEERRWYESLRRKGSLTYRSLFKILKVARTIADLEESPIISIEHLQEAWGLRFFDSTNF